MKKIVFPILCFALGLVGCATTLHTLPPNFALGTKEESVVAGRVTIDMGVKPVEFFDRLNKIELTVKNEASGKDYVIVCDAGGSDSNFYVALPPGLYSVKKFKKAQLESAPSGRFVVGEGQVVYIGTLKFVRRQGAGSFALGVLMGGAILGDWRVEDEYEEMVRSFREKYPQMNQEVVKSLIAE